MILPLSIAASGMRAAGVRVAVAADNVANVFSTGRMPNSASGNTTASANPVAYRAKDVQQTSVVAGGLGVGTVAVARYKTPDTVALYAPDLPYADENGMVAAPNVSLDEEMVNLLVAKGSYQANAKIVGITDEMSKTLLDIVS
ncbi:flagellar basal body rod protein FlgC [Lacibacterium aquatile]|uniref:Flagellar basal body rod protein FlgC n=1 Tax=Lacibacterium aquatile TaxID=1168082 RepID=A0ABW5DR38_9PROT